MTPDSKISASWRDVAEQDQLFDEDLRVILRRTSKRQRAPAAKDSDRGKSNSAVLDGWTNPLVYHRAAHGSSSLSILVDSLKRSRIIACATGVGCEDAGALNLSMNQVANAWDNFVLPLERMNRSQIAQDDSAPINEEEKIARQAVVTQLLAMASAKETCLKYGPCPTPRARAYWWLTVT
jgi:hypothetical protein